MRVVDYQTIELGGDADAVLVLVALRSHLLAEVRAAIVGVLLRGEGNARIQTQQRLPRWRHLLRFAQQFAARRGANFDGVVEPLREVEDAIARLEPVVEEKR